MVSVNSSSNAWTNWQARNPPPPSEPAPAPAPTPAPSTDSGATTASEPTPAAPVAQPIITDAPAAPLVYSAPAPTQLGRAPDAAAQSLGGLLEKGGFFSASATAEQTSAASEPAAASALPEALTQAEVVARAAYQLVSKAGAEEATSTLIRQLG